MKPKVSVIIAAYNGEKTIKRCIDSITGQTLNDIEIIIVDDGSADDTLKIARECGEKDERIRIITQENTGQGIARNRGMEIAYGEYIGFVDCDDTIDEDMYKSMLDMAQQCSADVVQCNILDVYLNGTKAIQLPIIDSVINVADRAKYFSRYIFRNLHSLECCNKLIRAGFLKENNISFYSNAQVYAEDLLFNLELALKLDTIVFIGRTFYNYYQLPNAHSKANGTKKILLLCNLFEIFSNKVENPELKQEVGKLAVLIIMINLSHILDTEEGQDGARQLLVRKDIRRYLRYAFRRMKKLHHKVIMLYILIMPMSAKITLIKRYYESMK